jgi:hypothetical protein
VPLETRGTIRVLKLIKDGLSVTPVSRRAEFTDDPMYLIGSSLVNLKPGESVALRGIDIGPNESGQETLFLFSFLPYDPSSKYDELLQPPGSAKSQELRLLATGAESAKQSRAAGQQRGGRRSNRPPSDQVALPPNFYEWRYALASAGNYTLALAFQYSGHDTDPSNVFVDQVVSNEITFTVQ